LYCVIVETIATKISYYLYYLKVCENVTDVNVTNFNFFCTFCTNELLMSLAIYYPSLKP